PHFGAVGAAYAKSASQLVAAILFIAYLVVHFRSRLPMARIGKLLFSSAMMFIAVRLVQLIPIHAVGHIVLGIPVGAVVFILFLRAFHTTDEGDGARLGGLARLVPARARGHYRAIIDFLAPIRATAST